MSNNKSQRRFGLWYVSNGRWTGPYAGRTFTESALNRNPLKTDIRVLANTVLKSRVQVRPVKTV